jgi:hypothetical protein
MLLQICARLESALFELSKDLLGLREPALVIGQLGERAVQGQLGVRGVFKHAIEFASHAVHLLQSAIEHRHSRRETFFCRCHLPFDRLLVRASVLLEVGTCNSALELNARSIAALFLRCEVREMRLENIDGIHPPPIEPVDQARTLRQRSRIRRRRSWRVNIEQWSRCAPDFAGRKRLFRLEQRKGAFGVRIRDVLSGALASSCGAANSIDVIDS